MPTPALESALLIKLVDTIPWGDALKTEASTGALATVDPDADFDASIYQRRDRELAYRDLINVAAVAEVSVEISSVWNADAIRPSMEGLSESKLSIRSDDISLVNSKVRHVKHASIPYDAARYTDKDLAGRDALLYETLAKACAEVFVEPPVKTNDPGHLVTMVTPWSKAEGVASNAAISTALPLNRDLFKAPDQNLAERDNQVAGYVSRLVQVLRNPFAYATRLYVSVQGSSDSRESEVYSISRPDYVVGTVYYNTDEVFYVTGWYRAKTTTSALPTTTSDWDSIAAPTFRTWVADPALTDRNRIVYDTTLSTLQWFRETRDLVHIPQIYAMTIQGIDVGQTLKTEAIIPENKDAQFWRQKATKIEYSGTKLVDIASIQQTAGALGGYSQEDTASLTVPDWLQFTLPITVNSGTRYRVSTLVRPDSSVKVSGSSNQLGLYDTQDKLAVTFSGAYAPTEIPPASGIPVRWSVKLPVGAWKMYVGYTNTTGTTQGFGLSATVTGDGHSSVIMEDTVPIPFVDSNGLPLENLSVVESLPVSFPASGVEQFLDLTWTYGVGMLQVKHIRFELEGVTSGRYSLQASLVNGSVTVSTVVSTIDATGQDKVFSVMPFEFTATGSVYRPTLDLRWFGQAKLPLQVRHVHVQQHEVLIPTPYTEGFQGWKHEALERAVDSVVESFSMSSKTINPVPVISFGGTWDKSATERYMSYVEVYESRLRELTGITSGNITDGRQYEVTAGSIVYNSGTKVAGSKFTGTRTTSAYTDLGSAVVRQVGAFRKSHPGDVGKPALVPSGLAFDVSTGVVKMSQPVNGSVPQLTVLQPWMVESGIYVSQPEFWSPNTL